MRSVSNLPNLRSKCVIVRVDYNVPNARGKIVDHRRIDSSFQTINTILKKGGVPVLISHLGENGSSLKPVAKYLSQKYKLSFITKSIFDKDFREVLSKAPKGSVILLENIRDYKEEEKNDPRFAKLLASFGEFYVNDAFPVSHRKHASIVGIPKYLKSFVGCQFITEINNLDKVLKNKSHPFLFVLGGAKLSTKIPLLKKFLGKADNVVIAGELLNNFYKVLGFDIGKSLFEKGFDGEIKKILKNPKILLPTDVVVLRDKKTFSISPTEVMATDIIVDAGRMSTQFIVDKIRNSKLVVWNGPLGWYEKGSHIGTEGTIALAKAIFSSSAQSIIGGGDTAAVIEDILRGKKSKNIFVSTGGGATLDYLVHGTLPGIEALK